uniref:Uncharacterized protein n=1 Tax=Anguilla anguilla TaxID=7936 RepID=A0A0E9Q8S9_ANGAN
MYLLDSQLHYTIKNGYYSLNIWTLSLMYHRMDDGFWNFENGI